MPRSNAKARPVAQTSAYARSKLRDKTLCPSTDVQPKGETKPPRKRQKTSHTTKLTEVALGAGAKPNKTKRKGKSRALEFADLPLDVLLEIFVYLHPLDLLNLSYTTKELRSILTADYTASIWKKVYKTNISPNFFGDVKYPPKCPHNVDVRHYTSVLFGDTCLFCASPNAPVVHWGALTRLCRPCALVHLDPYHGRSYVYQISHLCLRHSTGHHDSVPPVTAWTPYVDPNYILKKDLDKQIRILEQCVDDAAKTVYKASRTRRIKAIHKSASKLASWANSLLREKYPSPEERGQWFRAKLAQEGIPYEELGNWRNKTEELPAVQTIVPFSDDAWDAAKAEVLRVFELQRQKDRKISMIDTLKHRILDINDLLKLRLRNHPKPWIHPPLSTIAKSEHFSRIIRTIDGSSCRHVIRAQLSNSAAPRIPEILTTWRAEADKFLLGLLVGARMPATDVDGEDVDTSSLELATTFFKCQFCTDPISYPRILIHQCLRRRRKVSSPDGDADEREPLREVHGVLIITEESIWNRMPWWLGPTWNEARQFISVDETATKSAKAIVRACGEDPNVLISNDMNERNFRLECRRCSPAKGSKSKTSGSRRVMTWKLAILHDLSAHPDNISSRGWSLVTSESVLAQVEERETNRRSATKTHQRCRHCGVIVQSAIMAADHLSRKHSIVAPAESMQEHLYVLLDIPMKANGSIVKI